MNKQQYKRAYKLYRTIVLFEKQISPNSTNAYNYIWNQIKLLNIELSEIDEQWCAMEHYDDAQALNPYDDFNWVWFKFPMYISHAIEEAFQGKQPLTGRARLKVRNYLDLQSIPF